MEPDFSAPQRIFLSETIIVSFHVKLQGCSFKKGSKVGLQNFGSGIAKGWPPPSVGSNTSICGMLCNIVTIDITE